ncbi:MAG TPA: hypothetical protein DIU15_00820 [Deltaproteobacteria bacterium]|nr:hypothetical protein [Deltaproteobacteria bacterium]
MRSNLLSRLFPTVVVLLLGLSLAACPPATDSSTVAAPAADPAPAPAASPAADAPAGVAAVVQGKEISFADLEAEAAPQLIRLKTQAHDIRKQTLDRLIETQLLEAEASKRGMTSDALIKTEVADKLPEVTEEEAKAYFDKNPPRGGVEFEKIKPRVISYLQRKGEQDRRVEYIGSLREAAGVEVMLKAMRFEIGYDDDDPIYGSKDAPVTIIEFSDFQCPYCSRVNPTIDRVKKEYGDKIALVFRDFPLPMHKEAPKAHEAASCANEQGKFWEYHDVLFENQRALQIADLKGYAGNLGLDQATFDGCLDSNRYTAEVELDKKAGAAVGVSGTPAFFINGQFLNGARPFESFKELIDGELKAKGLL